MCQEKHGLQNYDETDQALLYPHDVLDSPICRSDCWRSVPEISRKIKPGGPITLKQEGMRLVPVYPSTDRNSNHRKCEINFAL
jgi:hypothetical protein